MFGISIEHRKIMVTKPLQKKGEQKSVSKTNLTDKKNYPHVSKIFPEKLFLKA